MKVYPPPSKALLSRLRKLTTRKGREEYQHFLAEGPCLVEECLSSGLVPRNLIFSDSASECLHLEVKPFLESHKHHQCWTLPDKEFRSLCDTTTPQGVLGEFQMPDIPSLELFGQWDHPEFSHYTFSNSPGHINKTRVVVLDSIQEPGNVGTAIRCSVGLGASAMVLTSGCADLWNSKTLRSSAGALFRIPIWAHVSHAEIEQRITREGYTTWVADPRGDSIFGHDSIPDPLVLVLGNEARGPGMGWEHIPGSQKVGIPLSRELESLNVGTALAALLAVIGAIDSRQEG